MRLPQDTHFRDNQLTFTNIIFTIHGYKSNVLELTFFEIRSAAIQTLLVTPKTNNSDSCIRDC